MNKEHIDKLLKIYKCDVEKNRKCNKKNCAIYQEDRYGCTHTLQYRYAKKTLLNFFKKLINKTRGVYKYE